MYNSNDSGQMEYAVLMNRSQTLERTGAMTWTIATTAAVALMAWAIADNSTARMLAVVFAVAIGFHCRMSARQQTRLVAGYIQEFIESRGAGPQWFTRLGHLQIVPAINPSSDWFTTGFANVLTVAAIVFAWLFAGGAQRGELMAGLVTACGVAFAIYSVTETSRVGQTDYAAMWRKVSAGPKEVERKRAA